MERSALLDRITLNPEVCHGKPTIRNKRYMVTSMLDYLAGGDTIDELLEEFDDLERDDFLACIAYATTMLKVGESAIIHSIAA